MEYIFGWSSRFCSHVVSHRKRKLTKTQRKEAFLLREKLRYQKNVLKKKNLKISRGRIVEVVTEATNEDSQTDEQGTGLFDDAGGGATASAGHPISN